MRPFQTFYLLFGLFVFAFSWLRGGHPERAGTAALVASFVVSYLLQTWIVAGVRVGEAVVDVLLLLFFGVMAIRFSRWWLLGATSTMILTVAVHVVAFTSPDLGGRADVAARWGLGVLLLACMLFGVWERSLAGEHAISAGARWAPRKT